MTNEEILQRGDEFKYTLLGRLLSDSQNWVLDKTTKLWGINPKDHVETMNIIFDSLDVKPYWLSVSELKVLTNKMSQA